MCFSATASFVTGSVLLGAGVASSKIAKKPGHLPFAVIPLIFGVQQICEGFLWLALEQESMAQWQAFFTIAFLLFAQGVWPFWVPYSMWRMEQHQERKTMIKAFLVIGAMVSLYLIYCIFTFPVAADAKGDHINYVLNFPHSNTYYLTVLYLIPILCSPLASSVKRMNIIGVLVVVSFLITAFFFEGYVISVWCFFAAIISLGVLGIVHYSLNHEDSR